MNNRFISGIIFIKIDSQYTVVLEHIKLKYNLFKSD